jgi:hypothetical protein
MSKKQKQKRYEKLLKKAMDRCLEEYRFSADDWLSTKEGKEFWRLEYDLGYTDSKPER